MRSYKLKIFLLTLVLFAPLPSQHKLLKSRRSGFDTITVNQTLPKFLFKVEHDTLKTGDFVTKVSIYNIDGPLLIQTIIDTSYAPRSVEADDINLDGYTDISLNDGFAYLTPTYDFWLFDPKQIQFAYSKEFSNLHSYSIDSISKTIESSSYELGGIGGDTQKFRVVNNHLVLFESSRDRRDDSETREIVDGKMQITEQSTVEFDQDTLQVVIDKKLVFGSLRTVAKTWRTDFQGEPTEEQERSEVFQTTPWGNNYILLRKEAFSYERLANGKISQKVTKYVARNGKWKRK